MKRWMLALAALALLGLTTSVATAATPSNAKSDGATLQSAVLHADNSAQLDTVGWRHGGWGWGGRWGGYYGGYWPSYSYYGGYWPSYSYYGGYPYYGGYWSSASYPSWGCGGCCY